MKRQPSSFKGAPGVVAINLLHDPNLNRLSEVTSGVCVNESHNLLPDFAGKRPKTGSPGKRRNSLCNPAWTPYSD